MSYKVVYALCVAAVALCMVGGAVWAYIWLFLLPVDDAVGLFVVGILGPTLILPPIVAPTLIPSEEAKAGRRFLVVSSIYAVWVVIIGSAGAVAFWPTAVLMLVAAMIRFRAPSLSATT
jgi:hypothetical protein